MVNIRSNNLSKTSGWFKLVHGIKVEGHKKNYGAITRRLEVDGVATIADCRLRT